VLVRRKLGKAFVFVPREIEIGSVPVLYLSISFGVVGLFSATLGALCLHRIYTNRKIEKSDNSVFVPGLHILNDRHFQSSSISSELTRKTARCTFLAFPSVLLQFLKENVLVEEKKTKMQQA